jgi:hypothetical protein
MSTDDEHGVISLFVPQGTRFAAGDLVIGLGGVLVDPARAILSLSDRRQRDVESSYLTMAVGETCQFGDWEVSLSEIKEERGQDVARIDVAPVGAAR